MNRHNVIEGRHGAIIPVTADDAGLLVTPDVARQQIDEEPKPTAPPAGDERLGRTDEVVTPGATQSGSLSPQKPQRYHGTVRLDAARVGRDAGKIPTRSSVT